MLQPFFWPSTFLAPGLVFISVLTPIVSHRWTAALLHSVTRSSEELPDNKQVAKNSNWNWRCFAAAEKSMQFKVASLKWDCHCVATETQFACFHSNVWRLLGTSECLVLRRLIILLICLAIRNVLCTYYKYSTYFSTIEFSHYARFGLRFFCAIFCQ